MVGILAAAFWRFDVLPSIGDPHAPAATHVSDYYIENAVEKAHSPNMVTAVIVDFRAFDTMYETTVMFLAGVGVVLILAGRPVIRRRVLQPKRYFGHRYKVGDPIYRTINKDVMITLIEPLILIYAVYVLFHGEVSLGGGFQAGALIALTYIIDVMVIPNRRDLLLLPKQNSAALGGIGTFLYLSVGILTMVGGGHFLDYDFLPLPVETGERHSIAILLVEVGVTVCVMATIVTILNAIMERVRFDDDTDRSRSGR